MKEQIKKISLFCLSSFSSFIVDFLLFLLFKFILFGCSSKHVAMAAVANVMARVISATFNYTLNTKIVFKAKKSIKSASSYFLLALFILVLNTTILSTLTKFGHIDAGIGKLVTETIMFFVSYLIQNKIIFGRKEKISQFKNEIGEGL